MYDPTEFIANGRLGYVVRHCKADYMQGSPLIERLNPLRYEIGVGASRPCRFKWNRDAWMLRAWANFNWWLWKRRYRDIFGYPRQSR